MSNFRLMLDPPATGSWNMAVDQALLEEADRNGQTTVRFYAWSVPTLSLGYFQKLSDRIEHAASRPCPMVRRSTGGGAILHDQEITYSICVPSTHRWSAEHDELYWIFHRTLVALLIECGVAADLYDPQSASKTNASINQKSFLCFQRRSPGDVTLAGYKIGGSAQRRKKNALLQHGSVILQRSAWGAELPGIGDLAGAVELDRTQLIARWIEQLQPQLQGELIPGEMTLAEIKAAELIETSIFRSEKWNHRR